MPDQKLPPQRLISFSGAPVEIGGQIFERLCIPAVRKVSNQLGPLETKQLYCGFLSGLLGAMTADFGQEQAKSIAQTILDAFDGMDLGAEARQQ